MVSVLREQNILLIYSKYFLFFEWKLEMSDLRGVDVLESPKFNLGEEEKKSYLIIAAEDGDMLGFYLGNPKPLENGYYVLTILDKNNSCIKCISKSTDHFKKFDIVDLFGENRTLPSNTEYPIKVICTAKSSINDHILTSGVNYEKRMSEISSDLKNVLDQGLNTDIQLITDGDDINAHQIILQARSPVFRRMFEHESKEASKKSVDISDIGSTTVKRLVNFLYTGIMDKCDFDEAMELYYAADKYEVLSLREDCKLALLKHLDVSNACLLFTLARRHNDDDLKDIVVQFVSANYRSVINSDLMNELSKDDMLLLMRLCFEAGINS